jgi:Flp pilus assembly CpaF family ATPase
LRARAYLLRTALGPAIAAWLEDSSIVEVMLNPYGRLWSDRLGDGLADTGEQLAAADGERIVRLVAHHVGAEVHPSSPRVSAELPETGERFEGLIPPLVTAPAFAIRKPAVAVFSLNDYGAAGIMTAEQAAILRDAVAQRRNILIAGGTSTGKTTQRASRRSGEDRRPSRADRGHPRAAMQGEEPCRAADEGRKRGDLLVPHMDPFDLALTAYGVR